MSNVAKFSTLTIEEATERLIDYRGKTPPKTNSGVRLVTAKVVKGGQIHDEPAEYIAADFYDEWMRRGLPQKLDVLLTTEAPLGEVAILRDDARIALAQRIILLRAKPGLLDPLYLFYALQSDFGQGELKARASGTTVLGIKQSELRKVRIPFFPLPYQQHIAGILSAYDELIENSQRRIKILDAMARALYREWFVHFRFPGHENHPRVASPLGEIPQGWEVKKLEDIVRFGSGKAIKPGGEGVYPVYGSNGIIGGSDEFLHENGVVIGRVGAYCGAVVYCRSKFWASDNTLVAYPASMQVNTEFLYSLLADAELNRYAGGAAQPLVTQTVLKQIEVLMPPAALLEMFGEVAGSFERQMTTLQRQSKNLRLTRDLLLPRLLSGQSIPTYPEDR